MNVKWDEEKDSRSFLEIVYQHLTRGTEENNENPRKGSRHTSGESNVRSPE